MQNISGFRPPTWGWRSLTVRITALIVTAITAKHIKCGLQVCANPNRGSERMKRMIEREGEGSW
jgi:hypothetical protein